MNDKSELEDFKADLIGNEKDANRDRILSGIVIYMFITFIFFRTMPVLFEDWYQFFIFPYMNFALNICWAFIPLLLARQLKADNLRQTGMIFGTLYLILSIGFSLKEVLSGFLGF